MYSSGHIIIDDGTYAVAARSVEIRGDPRVQIDMMAIYNY